MMFDKADLLPLPILDGLTDQLIEAVRKLEDDAIAEFFGGSLERAEKMLRLFPGRYELEFQRGTSESFMSPLQKRLVIRDRWTKRTEKHLLRVNLGVA